jgi:ATP-dependent Lon protease
VAEIKGHKQPSMFSNGLGRKILLLDEVDKIRHAINGDPASAFLEMLDPEQDNSFLDY